MRRHRPLRLTALAVCFGLFACPAALADVLLSNLDESDTLGLDVGTTTLQSEQIIQAIRFQTGSSSRGYILTSVKAVPRVSGPVGQPGLGPLPARKAPRLALVRARPWGSGRGAAVAPRSAHTTATDRDNRIVRRIVRQRRWASPTRHGPSAGEGGFRAWRQSWLGVSSPASPISGKNSPSHPVGCQATLGGSAWCA